jgi:hypothetical protein
MNEISRSVLRRSWFVHQDEGAPCGRYGALVPPHPDGQTTKNTHIPFAVVPMLSDWIVSRTLCVIVLRRLSSFQR